MDIELLFSLISLAGIGSGGFLFFLSFRKKSQRVEEERLEQEILRFALHRQDWFALADLAVETSLSMKEAEKILTDMTRKGYAAADITESGLMIYKCHHLGHQESPISQEPAAIEASLEQQKSPISQESATIKATFAEQINPISQKRSVVGAKKRQLPKNKVYLIKYAELTEEPKGKTKGKRYPAGTEFEYIRVEPDGSFLVKVDGEQKYLAGDRASTEDPRTFFKIKELGVVGYLVHMFDSMMSPDLVHINVNDTVVGDIRIEIKKIKSLQIDPLAEKKLIVESFAGKRYAGSIYGGGARLVIYFISDEIMIKLTERQSVVIESIRGH